MNGARCGALGAGALAVLLVGCGGPPPEQVVSEFPSRQGDYRLRLTLMPSDAASVPHTLRLYVLSRDARDAGAPVASTTVENEGSPFTGDQVRLTWAAERTVLLCVTPRAAARHGLRVELGEPPRVEQLSKC
ncbi:MAG: hypothetical protein AB7I01_14535 [Gammaproteobacteria bacterium]